eukprot:1924436-Pleurochrysis_carterae.AAC.2
MDNEKERSPTRGNQRVKNTMCSHRAEAAASVARCSLRCNDAPPATTPGALQLRFHIMVTKRA